MVVRILSITGICFIVGFRIGITSGTVFIKKKSRVLVLICREVVMTFSGSIGVFRGYGNLILVVRLVPVDILGIVKRRKN